MRALQDYPADRLLVIGPAAVPSVELLSCTYEAYPLPVTRWINSRFHHTINLLNSVGLIPIPRRWWLKKRVREFRPDLIVTVMDCFSYYSIAAAVARQANLPFLTITMDRPDSFESVTPAFRAVQFARIGRIYRQASVNVAVSRQMVRWIRRIFHCNAEAHYFAPSSDIPRGSPESCRTTRAPNRFVLGYAGSLEYGYERQVAALLPEIEAAGLTLRVHSAHHDRLPHSPALDFRGFLPIRELWQELLASCDALLLPYPFTHERASLYRTHFPTKLSEYYTLGLPILMLGPSYATGIRWGLDHPGSALVVTQDNPQYWRQALLRLKADSCLRVQLAANAQLLAQRYFSPASHYDFHQAVVRAASSARSQ